MDSLLDVQELKEKIVQLYVIENLTLKDVILRLKGFQGTNNLGGK
jgi:hypothetical protein